MTKNVIIAVLAVLLILAVCTNVVTHYGALKLLDEMKQENRRNRDDDRRWFRELTDEYTAKIAEQEHRLERFRDILRRHRIKFHEETGAVLEVAPEKIGAKPE